MIQRITPDFPSLFAFVPRSFIVSDQQSQLMKEFCCHKCGYIAKLDNGSLGTGIKVFLPSPTIHFQWDSKLAVVQQYIDSLLLDSHKFDFRIYVLVATVTPLRIHVYREGLTRICAVPSGGDCEESQLTNTAVNRTRADSIGSILRLLTPTFARLAESGVDTAALWRRIDEAIVLTLIACYAELERGERMLCPKTLSISRCFQVVGFDVLLDKNARPAVLEVNYRPSLEFDDERDERILKEAMLADAMRIAAPYDELQAAAPRLPAAQGFAERVSAARAEAAEHPGNRFECVFDEQQPGNDTWKRVMKKARDLGGLDGREKWKQERVYFAMKQPRNGLTVFKSNHPA
jgi:hypothetical protein